MLKKVTFLVVIAMAGMGFAGEIEIAREALRDGLWSVARSHARKSENPDADIVVFESYARERRWKDLLDAVSSRTRAGASEDAASYYAALAQYRLKNLAEASALLKDHAFADEGYMQLATCLKAAIAEDAGDAKRALELIESLPADMLKDPDTRMVIAQLKSQVGNREGAEKEWRGILALGTNVSERAYTIAAVELGGINELRVAYSNALNAVNRRLSGFALGRNLSAERDTFNDGARIIRSLVWADPDAAEARSAFLALGDAAQSLGLSQEALRVFQDALEAWPDSAKSPRLHFGRGWALAALARYDEALEAFSVAGELAETDSDKAMSLVKRGDVLSANGRAEDAVKLYRKALSEYPDCVSTPILDKIVKSREHEQRGREHYRGYEFEDADREFSEAARIDSALKPRMDFFHVLCLYGQGRDVEACSIAEKLVVDCADLRIRAEAALWLAKLAYNAADWAKARERFAQFLDLDSDSAQVPSALLWSARAAFAANDFAAAISNATTLLEKHQDTDAAKSAVLVQAEALIELSRFDEAVVVLDRLEVGDGTAAGERYQAQLLKADALFAMGADNSVRYADALSVYLGLRTGAALSPSERITVSFRIGKALEKLKRAEEALDCYYTDVVLAYRDGRAQGMRYSDEACAAFSRAAFRVADDMESRGRDSQAVKVLKLVSTSDVPAAAEAKKRIDRISRKGSIL